VAAVVVESPEGAEEHEPMALLRWLKSPALWAGVAAIAPVFANFGYKVLPLVQTQDWKIAARVADWYLNSGAPKHYPRLLVAHPGVAYALDWAPLDPRLPEWNREAVAKPQPWTVLVWDEIYGKHNADRRKSVDWRLIGQEWHPVQVKGVSRERLHLANYIGPPEWMVFATPAPPVLTPK
jgi:hypothetical protein